MNGKWVCQCGTENDSNFCTKCGSKRPELSREKINLSKENMDNNLNDAQQTLNNYSDGNSSNNSGKYKIAFGVGILLVVGIISVAVGYMLTNDDSVPASRKNVSSQQELSSSSTANTTGTEQSTSDTKVQEHPITMELSLGKFQMGDTLQYVKSIMGKENKVGQEDDLTRYYYPDIEVVFQHDAVVALVSSSEKLSTKGGIHQGSDFGDVTAKYGTDYQYFEYENLKMYEYPYTLPGGGNGLLRFAVNKSDNKVNYISARMLLD